MVMLVDPAGNSPELCRVELDKLAEALSVRSTGLLGFWVISDVGQSEGFR